MMGFITWSVSRSEWLENFYSRPCYSTDILSEALGVWESVPGVIRVTAHVLDHERDPGIHWTHYVANPYVLVDEWDGPSISTY